MRVTGSANQNNLLLKEGKALLKSSVARREDAPMSIVLSDAGFRTRVQEILFPLKIKTDRLIRQESFRDIVTADTGIQLPEAYQKKILELMTAYDEKDPLTMETIHEAEHRKEDFVFFYAPEDENGYLSNWYPSYFILEDEVFTSTEQYLMFYKAMLFGDDKTKREILLTDDLATIKKLGRQVSNYEDKIWNVCRQLVMEEGLRAKFSQNEELRRKLLETGEATLAECAPRDLVWGIGISRDDEARFDRSSWRGENRLGQALMKIRGEMQD